MRFQSERLWHFVVHLMCMYLFLIQDWLELFLMLPLWDLSFDVVYYNKYCLDCFGMQLLQEFVGCQPTAFSPCKWQMNENTRKLQKNSFIVQLVFNGNDKHYILKSLTAKVLGEILYWTSHFAFETDYTYWQNVPLYMQILQTDSCLGQLQCLKQVWPSVQWKQEREPKLWQWEQLHLSLREQQFKK